MDIVVVGVVAAAAGGGGGGGSGGVLVADVAVGIVVGCRNGAGSFGVGTDGCVGFEGSGGDGDDDDYYYDRGGTVVLVVAIALVGMRCWGGCDKCWWWEYKIDCWDRYYYNDYIGPEEAVDQKEYHASCYESGNLVRVAV